MRTRKNSEHENQHKERGGGFEMFWFDIQINREREKSLFFPQHKMGEVQLLQHLAELIKQGKSPAMKTVT